MSNTQLISSFKFLFFSLHFSKIIFKYSLKFKIYYVLLNIHPIILTVYYKTTKLFSFIIDFNNLFKHLLLIVSFY